MRDLVKTLCKAGKHVDVVPKTLASVSNCGEGAVAANHWVRQEVRTGGCVQCDVLVCEEITQMYVQLWFDVRKVTLANVSFILCGFSFNLLPYVNTGRGARFPMMHLESLICFETLVAAIG